MSVGGQQQCPGALLWLPNRTRWFHAAAIGTCAAANGTDVVAIGNSAQATGVDPQLGADAMANGLNKVLVLSRSQVYNTNATAIGAGAVADGTSATSIGAGSYGRRSM